MQVKNQINETQTEESKKSEPFNALLKLVKELTQLALSKARSWSPLTYSLPYLANALSYREGGSHQINFISKLSESFGIAIFPSQSEGIYNSILVPWIKDQLSSKL